SHLLVCSAQLRGFVDVAAHRFLSREHADPFDRPEQTRRRDSAFRSALLPECSDAPGTCETRRGRDYSQASSADSCALCPRLRSMAPSACGPWPYSRRILDLGGPRANLPEVRARFGPNLRALIC